jgi:3-deoxy-D-manno-octulosonate 8-phosphate phosphatase (KDO 8-P phosphatase)
MPALGLEEIKRRAGALRLLLFDVDGVMTDGGIILIGDEGEAKRFDIQDGMGVTLARAAGLKVGIVTGRNSRVVQRRAEELGIDEVCQGYFYKEEALNHLLEKYGLDASEVAYVGDDVLDLPVLKRVGLPIAVQNARPEVKAHCLYVAHASGGRGALREVIDWLLALREQKDELYDRFAACKGDGSTASRPN